MNQRLTGLLVLMLLLAAAAAFWPRQSAPTALEGATAKAPEPGLAAASDSAGNAAPARSDAGAPAHGPGELRVVDAVDGTPLPESFASAAAARTRLLVATSATWRADAEGRIGLPPELPGLLLVGAPGHRSREVAPAHGKTEIVRLDRLLVVDVVCSDEGGHPLPGAHVAASKQPIVGCPNHDPTSDLLSGDASDRGIQIAVADQQGHARLAIAAAGDYWLRPWADEHGCVDSGLFERPTPLQPGQTVTLRFRAFQAVAVAADQAPLRAFAVNFPGAAKQGIDRDLRHLMFDAERVERRARERLQARWPHLGVRAFVARPDAGPLTVQVLGVLDDGRPFAANVESLPIAALVPTIVRAEDAAIGTLLVVGDDASPGAPFVVQKEGTQLRIPGEPGQTMRLPTGDYEVVFAGEWIAAGGTGKAVTIAADETTRVSLRSETHRRVELRIRHPDVPDVGRVQLQWQIEGKGEHRSFNWNPRVDHTVWLPVGRQSLVVHCPGYAPCELTVVVPASGVAEPVVATLVAP